MGVAYEPVSHSPFGSQLNPIREWSLSDDHRYLLELELVHHHQQWWRTLDVNYIPGRGGDEILNI